MISAAEALQLPSAQLSADELAAADRLEATIEENIRKFMERRGIDMKIKEINGNVIAEVNQRLKRVGYAPQWQPLVERHKLSTVQQTHVGFSLSLAPTDEAYKTATRVNMS